MSLSATLNFLMCAGPGHVGCIECTPIREAINQTATARVVAEFYWGAIESFEMLRNGEANCLYVEPEHFGDWKRRDVSRWNGPSEFIQEIRERLPSVVIVLGFNGSSDFARWNAAQGDRYEKYLRLVKDSSSSDARAVMNGCQIWHDNFYRDDYCLSFAGADRQYANDLTRALVDKGARVFYDEDFQHELTGKNLYEQLAVVYGERCRHCIVLCSKHYAHRDWTRHEYAHAADRALRQNSDYLLPVRLDDVSVPGLPSTIAYLDARKMPLEKIADLLVRKSFGPPARKR